MRLIKVFAVFKNFLNPLIVKNELLIKNLIKHSELNISKTSRNRFNPVPASVTFIQKATNEE